MPVFFFVIFAYILINHLPCFRVVMALWVQLRCSGTLRCFTPALSLATVYSWKTLVYCMKRNVRITKFGERLVGFNCGFKKLRNVTMGVWRFFTSRRFCLSTHAWSRRPLLSVWSSRMSFTRGHLVLARLMLCSKLCAKFWLLINSYHYEFSCALHGFIFPLQHQFYLRS